MESVVDELKKVLVNTKMGSVLMHYGVSVLDDAPGVGSGRFPLGSGDTPFQHGSGDLLGMIEYYQHTINPDTGKKYTDAEVAEILDIKGRSGEPSSNRLRAIKNILKTEKRSEEFAEATKLREEGLSYQQIAEKMGYKNDSSIRNLLNEDAMNRKNAAMTTAEYLKTAVDKYGMIDVGKGVEQYLGVSQVKLNEALEILQAKYGYNVFGGGIPQATNKGQQTNQLVLTLPDKQHKDIYQFNNIHSVSEMDTALRNDGEEIRNKWEYPSSIDSKRVSVVYGDEGGTKKDGLIEIRRGVDDISLGDNHYAQVRIMVDGTHYLKGMAIYSDDLPDGIDVKFNTNKKSGTPICGSDKNNTVLKKISDDPENPFGALLREEGGQTYYDDPKGKYVSKETGKKQSLNAVNITRQEGDWKEWADTLPSQFLAKQSKELARKQLKMAIDDREGELKDILDNTNPTVKKKLLNEFADSCDAAAVNLKAAALPRQKYQVILPLDNIKDTEVYAPGYKNGEQVALIRYPHAGTFEIPILTVNNRNAEGKRVLGNKAVDAIGINSNVAERLSGADFDGDTVQVIPTNNGYTKISSRSPLEDLKGFDPKMAYPRREGMKVMKDTQKQMGVISNLITDMTIKGASDSEMARAVKHSMVVIDAEKHMLDWQRSEKENDIDSLKRKYQQKPDGKGYGGASTLLSKAKSEVRVDKRQGSPYIDKETGEKIYKTAVDSKLYYTDNKGNIKKRQTTSTKMAEAKDAYELISDTNAPMERLYADYANSMKRLANTARLEMTTTPSLEYNPQAAKVYEKEVDSLKNKLKASEMNQVRERDAQRKANVVAEAKRSAYRSAGLTTKEINKAMKKESQRALTNARIQTGAHRVQIQPTDKEWEAIQSGAIHDTTLSKMLKYIDDEVVWSHTSGRGNNDLPQWKINKIQAMSSGSYTIEQIASSIGVSTSTVSKYL